MYVDNAAGIEHEWKNASCVLVKDLSQDLHSNAEYCYFLAHE